MPCLECFPYPHYTLVSSSLLTRNSTVFYKPADSREQHKKILDEIQAASFAKGWVLDHQNSEPVKGKPIEEVGQRLKEEIKKGK